MTRPKYMNDLRLGFSELTDSVFIFKPEKNNPENALHKLDVTSQFHFIATKLGYIKRDEKESCDHTYVRRTAYTDISSGAVNGDTGICSICGVNVREQKKLAQMREDWSKNE